jgi:hypothetical protein
MIKLNVHEAKTHLSYYLQKLKRATILRCRRNSIAEIRPLPAPQDQTRDQKGNWLTRNFSSPCRPILSTPFMVADHETAFGHGHIFVGRQRRA